MTERDKRFDHLDHDTKQIALLDEIANRLRDQAENALITNLLLFQAAGVVDSLATNWTDLLSLDINPDEEVYITYIDVEFDHGDNQQVRIISNNEVLSSHTPTIGGFIIMMFFNSELRFTTADKRPLVIQFKTDGVVGHEFTGEAQVSGVRRKIRKKA